VTFSVSPELYTSLEQVISFTYIIFIGFLGINQSKLFIQVRLYQSISKSGKVWEDNNSDPAINEEEKREIRRLIELIVKEKKLYLDPNLKIDHFAKKIHIPVKKLSQTIHNIYSKNFTNFINDYRIQEAVKILSSGEKISIDELSRNVGFNSRSTFNRAFKAFKELTPRDYLINHKISNDL
jgi:AraC-like DNA-binding protein